MHRLQNTEFKQDTGSQNTDNNIYQEQTDNYSKTIMRC